VRRVDDAPEHRHVGALPGLPDGAVTGDVPAALVSRPIDAVREDVLRPSEKNTFCPWKGTASYYSVEVDGQVNRDAAWYYPTPKGAAKEITGRVAFWKGVEVS
jgi:uncharacterized protein (DUF427 family)